MTDQDAEESLYRMEMDLEERRAKRRGRQKSGWKHPPQCPACRRLLSGHNVKCPGCGATGGAYPR